MFLIRIPILRNLFCTGISSVKMQGMYPGPRQKHIYGMQPESICLAEKRRWPSPFIRWKVREQKPGAGQRNIPRRAWKYIQINGLNIRIRSLPMLPVPWVEWNIRGSFSAVTDRGVLVCGE